MRRRRHAQFLAKMCNCAREPIQLELMDHRKTTTRSWRLDVYENGAEKVFEILFASIDETLNHLKPDNRKLVEMTAMRRRLLRRHLACDMGHVPRNTGTSCTLPRQALPRSRSRTEDDPRLEERGGEPGANVRLWHKGDIPTRSINVHYWG